MKRRCLSTATAMLTTTALVGLPAGTANAGAAAAEFWPHRRICTEGQITGVSARYKTSELPGVGALTRGTAVSAVVWIRPCPGEVPDDAGYGFVGYDQSFGRFIASTRPLGNLSEQTPFDVNIDHPSILRALCLIDHATGNKAKVSVSKVACVALVDDPSSDNLLGQPISVEDPLVSHTVKHPNADDGSGVELCGGCARTGTLS